MKNETIIILLLMMTALFHSPAVATEAPQRPVNEALKTRLKPGATLGEELSITTTDSPLHPVARFYEKVGYHPVWTGSTGLLPQGEFLLQMLADAAQTGSFEDGHRLFYPDTSRAHGIHGANEIRPVTLAPDLKIDVMLTHRLIQYAQHLSQGRLLPETIFKKWLAQRRPRAIDFPAELARALKDGRLHAYLESLHPKGEAYQGLRKALQHYREIKQSGGWSPIAAGPTLGKGDRGPRVEELKHRLLLTGEWSCDEPTRNDGFDESVETAVRYFQQRHGLKADGLVGKQTLAELNVPVDRRIIQLQLNMERWRWFPDSLGERYLMVNIPAFELRVVEASRRVEYFRVIVGKKGRQTPIMSDRMTYLELNPYWNIPQKIARKDILPKVIDDPSYLVRQGIRVFDGWEHQAPEMDPTTIAWDRLSTRHFPYRLRQDPSCLNALGQVKFIFPNPHSIYIHDTPGKTLFDRQERIFSSGCVRVEEPMALAHYLLNDQGWTPEKLQATILKGKRKSVTLDDPIPVHLVYFTAWTAEDGTVHFRDDIYGRDRRLLVALSNCDADPVLRVNERLMAKFTTPPIGLIPTIETPALTPAGDLAGYPMAGL